MTPIPPLTLLEAQVLADISLHRNPLNRRFLRVVNPTAKRLHAQGYWVAAKSGPHWTEVTPDGFRALREMFEWAMLVRLVLTT